MVLSTEWSQVEVIDLLNDGNGLGFILVGGKSTGVVIKALTPGGIAERDGRMQCGDHVLQIGEVNLRGFSSEQAATVLRQTGAQVRLIVARPVEPTSPDYQALASHAPIIPTKLLTDPEELERQLIQTAAISGPFFSAQDAMLQAAATAAAAAAAAQANLNEELLRLEQRQQLQLQHKPQPTLPPNHSQSRQQRVGSIALSPCALNVPQMYSPTGHGCCANDGTVSPCDGGGDGGFGTGYDSESSCGGACLERTSTSSSLPETETFDVVLHRNVYGLGIRVAGYVCEEEDLSGIFVKSMVEGGAGEAGRVRINDRILAVDGRSVAEATNHEAVTLLKNSGITVHLRIERFLRGRKYEHLQVALNDMKEVNIAAPSTAATAKTAPTTAATTPAGGLGDTAATRRGTADGALALDMGRLMVNSETMQSISQLSLPPSPSCATLTWVAPKSDADSLATVDIDYPDVILDDKQIEAEFESHTTVDSDIFIVQYHANGSKTASCSSYSLSPTQESTPIPATLPPTAPNTGAFSADSVNGTDLFPFSPPAHKTPTSAVQPTSAASSTKTDANPTAEPTAANTNSTNSTTSTTIHWSNEYPDSRIIVAQLHKLAGLGISLEGTVDVEGGIEKRPHHFIRSILGDGPVDLEGSLRPGDEILQVNEHRLQGLTHTEVVRIFKELPAQVRMVCARGPSAPSVINTSQNLEAFRSRSILAGGLGPIELATVPDVVSLSGSCTAICGGSSSAGLGGGYMTSGTLVKALSESSLFTASLADSSPLLLRQKPRSRSVEQVSGLALWSSDVVYVELLKTENGFGFSVLDYQDPLDVDGTVIVVRGLIPGGAAESSQQLFPGDRIISVGEVLVNGKTLDEAVEVLKGMPLGMVRIGLCRPLPVSDDSDRTTPT